jgi:hypothetical protein
MSGLAVMLPQLTKTPFNGTENPSMSEVAIMRQLRRHRRDLLTAKGNSIRPLFRGVFNEVPIKGQTTFTVLASIYDHL